MKPFLQPLSAKEEMKLIGLLRSEDSRERESAKEKLIEHNMRLVAHIAKKYQTGNPETEELIAVGTVGLVKAILSFDETKGSKLGTYAARCIDNELLMMMRAKKKTFREISLQEPVGTDQDGNELHLLDVIECEPRDIIEEIHDEEVLRNVHGLIERILTSREKQVLYMRYGLENGDEISQKEIGKQLGISRSYVSRIEKKALMKLKEAMEKQKGND